jgi:hypothetical protein
MVRLAIVALLLGACGYDDSATCGRGRCRGGTTCISIFGDGRQNQGWNDPHYPNVENEWWCFKSPPDCPSNCNNGCLQNPTDEGEVVCAVNSIELVMFSAGKSCLCDPTSSTHKCLLDQNVEQVQVLDGCFTSSTVLMTCDANVPCAAGTYHSGDQVPGTKLVGGTPWDLLYCPGFPTNQFAPWLPADRTAKIYVDNNACP